MLVRRLMIIGWICFSLGTAGCTSMLKPKTVALEKKPVQAAGIEVIQGLLQQADKRYSDQRYDEAQKLYQQVIDLDQKNLKSHYRLGNIAFRAQRWQDAQDRYETVIKLEPRHARAQYNLAMTYLTKAERHLKFYAANVDSSANLLPVTKLISALEEISNPTANSGSSKTAADTNSLDQLLDELAR